LRKMNDPTARPSANDQTSETPGDRPLEELLAEAQTRIEQQREAMLRAVADAENARKRAQAEAASAQKYALERFADALLPVMDSLEAALKTRDTSGVELTHKQLQSALDRASIRAIEPKPGERFDPHRHQAMAAVESAQDPNTVVAVMQKGYALHERVLRPALVTVAKNKSDPISDKDLE
jgi:molecular chaperone GrpE